MGVSNLTNSLLLTPPYSARHEHSKACNKIVSDSFKIIANGNSDIELLRVPFNKRVSSIVI